MTADGNKTHSMLFRMWVDRKLSGRSVRLKAAVCRKEGFPLNKTAVVRRELSNIPGGVILKSPLGGHLYWNVSDLALASHTKHQPK